MSVPFWHWLILIMQTALLGVGGWALIQTVEHGQRIAQMEEWRGTGRAYTPEEAKALTTRVDAHSQLLREHALLLREHSILLRQLENREKR